MADSRSKIAPAFQQVHKDVGEPHCACLPVGRGSREGFCGNDDHFSIKIDNPKEANMKRLLFVIFIGSLFLLHSFITWGQAPKPPKKTPELLNQGKKLYEQNCALCHGATGDGKGPAGVALKPPPRTFNIPFNQWTYSKGNLNKVFDIITKGIPNTAMVKWVQLSEEERWALVYTVIGFAGSKAPPKKK